jgi:hypothetical protein
MRPNAARGVTLDGPRGDARPSRARPWSSWARWSAGRVASGGGSALRTSCTRRASARRPPCRGGGQAGWGRWGRRQPQLAPWHPRWSTICRVAAATGPAGCRVTASPLCPAPRMSWSSFWAPSALRSGAPPGARGLPPPWGGARPAAWWPARLPVDAPWPARHSSPQRSGQARRQALATRRHQRTRHRRLRPEPLSSLAPLEADCLQLILPP